MILEALQQAFFATLTDLAPVVLIGVLFQVVLLQRPFPHGRTMLIGMGYVVAGLMLFRLGLDFSLIPIGAEMAARLATLGAHSGVDGIVSWASYGWLYAFAAAIGFAATLVEPTLITVADRVHDLTGGAVRSLTLRAVAAVGVACGLTIGTVRIVTGISLEYLLMLMLLLLLLLSLRAPRAILALAYDIGPMATSVATVPLIAALGVGIAANVPGRTPLADGFGLITLALLSPVASVLMLIRLQELLRTVLTKRERKKEHEIQISAGAGGRQKG